MKENVLLIGGAGYLGRVISEEFINKNYFVRVLDNCIYQGIKNQFKIKSSNFEFMYGDKSDLVTLKKALKNIDIVVFLSGLVGDPVTKKYPKLSKKNKY